MAIDFFAVASNGSFPTPTPTMEARMSFAGTWGCLGTAASKIAAIGAALFMMLMG